MVKFRYLMNLRRPQTRESPPTILIFLVDLLVSMQVLGISHVVIVTKELDKTVALYEELLGLDFGETIDARRFEDEGNRQQAKSRLSPAGIEIMTPTDDAHPVARYLEEHGTSVYLLQLRVADLEAARAHLAEKGVEPIEGLSYEDKAGYYMREYVYRPAVFDGVMFVLSEYHTPHPVERPAVSTMK
jgi:catechol 2,3-dioxygenase-like lactoylglutathione lyase family enzyme